MISDASEIELVSPVIGLDIETSPRRQFLRLGLKDIPPDPRLHKIVLCQVSVGDVVYVLRDNFSSLERILRSKKIRKVIHNAVFEQKFFRHEYGIEIENIWDTMLAYAIIESGHGLNVSLEDVCYKLLDIKLDKGIRDLYIEGAQITPQMIEYGAVDAWVLPRLYEILKDKLYVGAGKVMGLEHALIPAMVDLELNGFKLDPVTWGRQADKVHIQLGQVRNKLLTALPISVRRHSIMGGPSADVNLNSRDQMMELLEKAGIELPDLKARTVSDTLAQTNHPLLKLYSDYKKLEKAESTYGYTFLRHINPVTKRVHQGVRQLETTTGRLAGYYPNLMNIPKRGGTTYRECFIADLLNFLAAADYSQQELRILAQVTGDKNMLRAFKRGIDIHLYVARILFRNSQLTEDDPERNAAKQLNFALLYGMGANSLSLNLHCPVSEARDLMSTHQHTFPNIFAWKNDTVEFARNHGYVETLIGRRRNLEIELGDFDREAGNTPIQGSAADMTKMACILAHEKELKLVNVVHDEIIIEAPKDDAQDSLEVLQFCMMASAEKLVEDVPFATDGYVNDRWAKPKKEAR